MKNKIVAIMLCVVMILGMTGCGNKESINEKNETPNNSQETNSEKTNSENNKYVYSVSEKEMYIGNVPSKYGSLYNTVDETIDSFGHNFFIRHTIVNDEIKESYVGFKYNGQIYYIKGSDKELYEENQTKLKEIFGKDKCANYSYYFVCSDTNLKLNVTLKDDGYVDATDGEAYCQAFNNYSKCKIGGMR